MSDRQGADRQQLEWTGERFVPHVEGDIALEHLHRYAIARELAIGKVVLDIACGEGYGSAILADVASQVIGVDVAEDTVSHAAKKYTRSNLEFRTGSCSEIPLPDASVDLVVSFETIEHHDEHLEMMAEIRRVLRSDGVVIISSPDKYEYSDVPRFQNQFHIKELYLNEFQALLRSQFAHVKMLGQKVFYGSVLGPVGGREYGTEFATYFGNARAVQKSPGLHRPVYFVALASNCPPPQIPVGVFCDDYVITNLYHLVAERDGQLVDLSRKLTERDGEISKLNQHLLERIGEITKLNHHLIERDGEITKLNHHLIERDGEITKLNQNVAERDKRIQGLIGEVAAVSAQLGQILASRSWIVTKPFRYLRRNLASRPISYFMRVLRVARREGALLFNRVAVAFFRKLPVSHLNKQRVKIALFKAFGFALGSLEPYQRWKAYQRIQSVYAPASLSESSPYFPNRGTGLLPVADGVWEWADYSIVKSRIASIRAVQKENLSPTPPTLIDIAKESFMSAAQRVRIPVFSGNIDVSIIVPVFNNLRVTLECLISISACTDSATSYEIIVADDASTDETAEVIGSIPNIRVIRNEQNLGFLRNCNRALDYARGSYVLYLNNDVQVTPGWLNSLKGTFDSNLNVGAVGPRFLYPSGHLQEVGAAFRIDGTADMVGLNEDPNQPRFSYARRVDYVSGACLMLKTSLARQLKGFSEDFLPCYCEDSDLCLRIQETGLYVYVNPEASVVHHLSKTTAQIDNSFKMQAISKNLSVLKNRWLERLDRSMPKILAFYLPQFYPFPENDKWWGTGFTEWTNVTKTSANFVGHYQPRLPADLGYYDLRLLEVMERQAELARRYNIHGFCFYYYWFGGKRLLDVPIEQVLAAGKPDFPFCLCWANENWTRRWDGQENDVLMAQAHSPQDDKNVILDLIRFFGDARYIRVDGRPLILVYRVTLFPNFVETADRWRKICRDQGIGEIYIAMVESFDLVSAGAHPSKFGCDAAVEFPPQGMADAKSPSGEIINPDFVGSVADYRDLAVRYVTREAPGYTRFPGVMPGWDNSARKQNNSFCFEHATPGGFQAWLEEAIERTRTQHYGDERLVFVNAWNEWAEGAYLEPDRRFGHTYLEAVKNASEAAWYLRNNRY